MKKIVLFLAAILCAVPAYGQDEGFIVRYVNTASTSGGDGTTNLTSGANRAFASCQDFQNNVSPKNLTTAGMPMKVYFEGSAADTTACSLISWTLDATNYLWLIVDPSKRHPGKFSASHYRLMPASGSTALDLLGGMRFVRIEGFQFSRTGTNNDSRLIRLAVEETGVDIRFSSNIFTTSSTGTNQQGIYSLHGYTGTVTFYNNLFYKFDTLSSEAFFVESEVFGTQPTINLYNNTFRENVVGVRLEDNNVTDVVKLVNSLFTQNNADTNGAGTYINGTNFNCSNQGSIGYTVTGGAPANDSLSRTFTFVASDDFHLAAADVGATDRGTTDPGSGLFGIDFEGDVRGATWDCGWDENGTVGPPPPGPTGLRIARFRRRASPFVVPPDPPDPPAGSGIASLYLRDVGIESDPRVVFVEKFEEASITALLANWDDSRDSAAMTLVTDVHSDSPMGSHSLRCPIGATTGCQLFRGEATERSVVHVRYYVKYSATNGLNGPHHSGVWIGSEDTGGSGPLFPDPHAGTRPCDFSACSGLGLNPWFWSSIEQNMFGWLDTYSAFRNMRPDGGGTYWGNFLWNDTSIQIVKDQWTCMEHMIKLNTVGDFDGEYRVWKNGVSIMHLGKNFPSGTWAGGRFTANAPGGSPFEGLQWRTGAGQGINYIWLQNYHEGAEAHVLHFDHLVVATEYIGCLQTT